MSPIEIATLASKLLAGFAISVIVVSLFGMVMESFGES